MERGKGLLIDGLSQKKNPTFSATGQLCLGWQQLAQEDIHLQRLKVPKGLITAIQKFHNLCLIEQELQVAEI